MKRAWTGGALAVAIAIGWLVWPRGSAVAPPVAAPAASAPAQVERIRVVPRQHPTAAVAGTIRDEAGHPLAGAWACVSADLDTPCVTAGADGGFRIAGIAPGVVRASASAPGHLSSGRDLQVGEGEQRADFALARGGVAVEGTVEDLGGGPIAHARITSFDARAETDDRGHFAITLPSVDRPLSAAADGYAPSSILARARMRILLVPESRIAGRVVDDTGAPVSGARVAVDQVMSATTDVAGAFEIAHLAPGHHVIDATAPHARSTTRTIQLGLGQRRGELVLALRPASAIAVRLLAPDGKPCVEAWVWLVDRETVLPAPWRDGDGWFHFDGVAPGRYLGTIGCDRAASQRSWGPIAIDRADARVEWQIDGDARPDRQDLSDLRPPRPKTEPATITGQVVDDADRPLPGAYVVTVSSSAGAVTGGDGRFSIATEAQPGNSVELHAYAIGGGDERAYGWADKPVTIKLEQRAHVSGHVRRADGTVPAHYRVLVHAPRGGFVPVVFEDSVYEVDQVPTGQIRIGAEVDGLETAVQLDLAPGERRSDVDIVVPASATLTGRVLDAQTGHPLQGTRLLVQSVVNGHTAWVTHSDQVADETGRFSIRDVPAGAISIEGIPPGDGYSRFDRTLALDHGGTVDLGDLQVARKR